MIRVPPRTPSDQGLMVRSGSLAGKWLPQYASGPAPSAHHPRAQPFKRHSRESIGGGLCGARIWLQAGHCGQGNRSDLLEAVGEQTSVVAGNDQKIRGARGQIREHNRIVGHCDIA